MLKEHKKLLKDQGVDKIVFYFQDSPLTENIFTTCLLINKDANRIEARGVSICSLLDEFSKARGKQKASGRALKALLRKKNFFKINSSGRNDVMVKKSVSLKTKDCNQKILEELSSLDGFDKTIVKKSKDICSFWISMNYPMAKTNKTFKYKAEFRPQPANSIECKFIKS